MYFNQAPHYIIWLRIHPTKNELRIVKGFRKDNHIRGIIQVKLRFLVVKPQSLKKNKSTSSLWSRQGNISIQQYVDPFVTQSMRSPWVITSLWLIVRPTIVVEILNTKQRQTITYYSLNKSPLAIDLYQCYQQNRQHYLTQLFRWYETKNS